MWNLCINQIPRTVQALGEFLVRRIYLLDGRTIQKNHHRIVAKDDSCEGPAAVPTARKPRWVNSMRQNQQGPTQTQSRFPKASFVCTSWILKGFAFFTQEYVHNKTSHYHHC